MRRALPPLAVLLASVVVQFVVPRTQRRAPVLDEDTLPLNAPALAQADAPRSIDELQRRIAIVLEREGVPGVAVALVGRDGPIWTGGVGVVDTTTRAPVRADTVFRVASITKSIVGLGVMRLVEQGRLDLDRPLREVLPGVVDNAWEDVAPVTLAQVLEHTAGLDDMRPSETFTHDDAVTPAAALELNPRSRTIRWRPGSRMSYSNVGYTIAARAIEVVTGEPFDVWLRREVLIPLGMPDADFRRTEVLARRLATGYIERDRAARGRPIAHRPAGALLASASDLARLVQFWLRRGEDLPAIVSPAGLDRIERAGTLPFPRTDVEYGLGNYGDVAHPVRARGHDGGLPGFASCMRYFPELGLGYVMLLNATHSLRAYVEIRLLVFAYLTRDRAVPAPPALLARAGPEAEFFAFANPRHALFGFIERAVIGWRTAAIEGGVRIDPLIGEPLDLVATKDGGYRLLHESGTSVRFTRNRDGTPVMVAHFAYAEAATWWPARARVIALAIALFLLQSAPLWAVGVLVIAALRRRRVVAAGLIVWPAIAGLCMAVLPRLFVEADRSEVLGIVHPWTVAICATTIGFAIASCAGLVAALRWSVRPDRPSLWSRLVPVLTAVASFGLTVWLGANGIIGLRTWAW